jgi:hypothetical protein
VEGAFRDQICLWRGVVVVVLSVECISGPSKERISVAVPRTLQLADNSEAAIPVQVFELGPQVAFKHVHLVVAWV